MTLITFERAATQQKHGGAGADSDAAAREAAKAAHLRYVSDTQPGIRREPATDNDFRYIGVDGETVTDEKTLARIRSLAIPPAYTGVWICPIPNGHLQATGRDVRGRKQYRYHPRWRETRDETKYDRMLAFGDALPGIRERVAHDLALRGGGGGGGGLPREKVLATIVALLETTRIRIGNEEYARANKSYGLTTLRNRHVEVEGAAVHFHFKGKSGKRHRIDIHNKKLARIVEKCRDLPGQELFQYVDGDGQRHAIHSDDVNAYIREISGSDFTAKDFRTWAGTVLCALCLRQTEAFEKEAEAKKNLAEAIRQVSEQLGNTPAVCRKCYIHPAILESYLEGVPIEGLVAEDAGSTSDRSAAAAAALHPHEAAVLSHLRSRASRSSSVSHRAAA